MIVRMRVDDISFAKIASKLGNGLARNDIMNRWNRHLKDKMLFSGIWKKSDVACSCALCDSPSVSINDLNETSLMLYALCFMQFIREVSIVQRSNIDPYTC